MTFVCLREGYGMPLSWMGSAFWILLTRMVKILVVPAAPRMN